MDANVFEVVDEAVYIRTLDTSSDTIFHEYFVIQNE